MISYRVAKSENENKTETKISPKKLLAEHKINEAEESLLLHTENSLLKPILKKSEDDKNYSFGKVRKVKRMKEPQAANSIQDSNQLDFNPEDASKGYMTARNETRDKIEMLTDLKDKETDITSSKLSKAFGMHK